MPASFLTKAQKENDDWAKFDPQQVPGALACIQQCFAACSLSRTTQMSEVKLMCKYSHHILVGSLSRIWLGMFECLCSAVCLNQAQLPLLPSRSLSPVFGLHRHITVFVCTAHMNVVFVSLTTQRQTLNKLITDMPNICSFIFQDQSGRHYKAYGVVISQTALLQAKKQKEKLINFPRAQ